MKRERRTFNGTFKANVVLEALKEQKTISELAHEHGLNPNLIGLWKKQFTEQLPAVFDGPTPDKQDEKEIDNLHKKIGQLTIEIDWLKKKSGQFIK
jgi:putative transposase